jgi:hypothetical protein
LNYFQNLADSYPLIVAFDIVRDACCLAICRFFIVLLYLDTENLVCLELE